MLPKWWHEDSLEDSAKECFPPVILLLTAAWWQHKHKQDASHYCGSRRSSILKNKSPVERNIVRWNRRLDWNAWLYRQTLSSTVLNTKFEKFHVFLSQYAANLNLCCQVFLYGSSCIPAILLCVQCCTLWKGKHSCLQPSTTFFWSQYFELEVAPCSRALVTLAITQSHSAWHLLTQNAKLKSCNVTH